MKQEKKGRASALLPIGIFLVIFIGAGIISNDFYTMPAIVGFLIALVVAFLQNPRVRFVLRFPPGSHLSPDLPGSVLTRIRSRLPRLPENTVRLLPVLFLVRLRQLGE